MGFVDIAESQLHPVETMYLEDAVFQLKLAVEGPQYQPMTDIFNAEGLGVSDITKRPQSAGPQGLLSDARKVCTWEAGASCEGPLYKCPHQPTWR